MKKILKTAGWQIGAFVLAIGAAFATNAMKDTTFFALEQGYFPMNTEATVCYNPDVLCDTKDTGSSCTWNDGSTPHNLYGEVIVGGLTKCIKELYRIPQ